MTKTKHPDTDEQGHASPPEGTPQRLTQRIAELEEELAQAKAENVRLQKAQKPTGDTPHAQPWETV